MFRNGLFRLIQWGTKKFIGSILILLVIGYLAEVSLLLAARGRQHLPAEPYEALGQSFLEFLNYLFNHPINYFWDNRTVPVFEFLTRLLANSFALLVLSLAVALIIGLTLGTWAALSHNRFSSGLITIFSVLGISAPSFLFAMFLWVINIQYHRLSGEPGLPAAGYGWDEHLIMPVIVLAMRPLAQITQVTTVILRDVFQQDYIRTAKAKGLSNRIVRNRHALRNAWIPILTSAGASLRFSLASLPIVELFFHWPGLGSTLVEAIGFGVDVVVLDLLICLGIFFLLVNLLIEVLFPLLDSRLRQNDLREDGEDHRSFFGWWRGIFSILFAMLVDFLSRILTGKKTMDLTPLPSLKTSKQELLLITWSSGMLLPSKIADEERQANQRNEPVPRPRWMRLLRYYVTNPSLIFGSLIVLGLVIFVVLGPRLAGANPYKTNGIMMINAVIQSPPFEPSAIFPWGSDYVGRDIKALVFHGARPTLTLAFFGMLARMIIGVPLGLLAGWQRGGWFDNFVMRGVAVWAAFPITLFAMLIIQALGIQQGMWVFIVAISLVGWGEVAQFIRSQVSAIKPLSFIESARSIGVRSDQILVRHVIPNLANALIVLSMLELGGILMLLAELGYLNIFMGGGFQANIAEVGRMQAVVVRYSDVPEWAAMIATVREWWRSYPWMAISPGLAFFISILAFNICGDGLRQFLDESQLNLSRLFNKYTAVGFASVVVILSLVLQGSSPMNVYRDEAMNFNPQRIMADISELTSSKYLGRETGMPGIEAAAQYISLQMENAGLLPAGEKGTYLQRLARPRMHLIEMPVLEQVKEDGSIVNAFVYRQEFSELALSGAYGDSQGSIVGLAFGPRPPSEGNTDPYGLLNTPARDRIVIVRSADLPNVNLSAVKGVLVIEDEGFSIQRKDVFPFAFNPYQITWRTPVFIVTSAVAAELLATTSGSMAQLADSAKAGIPGSVFMTEPGTSVHMMVLPEASADPTKEDYINVIGVYPGEGAVEGWDNQVIIVSAYYDGLGIGPDAKVYPGANDNASGVALLLELARMLEQTSFAPDKTVLFVAWAGGERGEGLSVVNIMNARRGANKLTVTEVIELSGVGYGSGNSIALGENSSYRLVKLFQTAAQKYDIPTTTRGRSPHYSREVAPGFGERKALTLTLSWDGSDEFAHTPYDSIELIDPQVLQAIGRPAFLTILVLSRETDY